MSLIGTVLTLTLLRAVLNSDATAGQLGAAGTTIAAIVRRWVDPALPAIPDLRPGAQRSGTPSLDASGQAAPTLLPNRLPSPTAPDTIPA